MSYNDDKQSYTTCLVLNSVYKAGFTLAKGLCNYEKLLHLVLIALVTLGDVNQIKTILSVLRCPRWLRQVRWAKLHGKIIANVTQP